MLTIGLDPVEIREIVGSGVSGAVSPEDARKTDYRVQRRPELVTHTREKVALGAARRLRGVPRAEDRLLVPLAVGDASDHRAQLLRHDRDDIRGAPIPPPNRVEKEAEHRRDLMPGHHRHRANAPEA